MDDQNRNLILATALSMVVILVWFVLFPPPEVPEDPNAQPQTETAQPAGTGEGAEHRPDPAAAGADPTGTALTDTDMTEVALDEAARIAIETGNSPARSRFVAAASTTFRCANTTKRSTRTRPSCGSSPPPAARNPTTRSTAGPRGRSDFEEVPGADTPWQVESGETLGVGSPVTLVWDNGAG
jgi:YidC/Oxa1 family membrane protein insertase